MKSRMESKMSSPVVIGGDIGKDVFDLVGFAADEKLGVDYFVVSTDYPHPDLPSRGHERFSRPVAG